MVLSPAHTYSQTTSRPRRGLKAAARFRQASLVRQHAHLLNVRTYSHSHLELLLLRWQGVVTLLQSISLLRKLVVRRKARCGGHAVSEPAPRVVCRMHRCTALRIGKATGKACGSVQQEISIQPEMTMWKAEAASNVKTASLGCRGFSGGHGSRAGSQPGCADMVGFPSGSVFFSV